MEILTLLRLNGRRLVALTIIGALTGAAAAAAVSQQAASYQASTTVFVGQALPDGASSFDVGPIVSDFEKAITLPQVRQATAERLELPFEDVVVTTLRNSTDGGSVEVTAQASTIARAEGISQTMSTETMRFLAQREVDRTTKFEQERQAAVDKAQAAVDKILTGNGFVDPTVTYSQTMAHFLQLTLDKSDPTKTFTNEQRVAADAETTRLRQQLPALKALADDFEQAKQELAQATTARDAAQRSRTAAEEVLAAATTELAISPGETVQASKLPRMLQAFAAAMVATFALGITFFFFVDGRRRRRAAAAGSAAEASRPATDTRPTAATGVTTAAARTGNGAATANAAAAKAPATADKAPVREGRGTPATGANGETTTATEPSKATKKASAGTTPAEATVGTTAGKAAQPVAFETVEDATEPADAPAEPPAVIDLRDPAPEANADARPTGKRPANGGLDEADSVFARPKTSGTAAATAGKGTGDPGTAAAPDPQPGGRGRKAAENRRRLGS